jgi:hypothetical protein
MPPERNVFRRASKESAGGFRKLVRPLFPSGLKLCLEIRAILYAFVSIILLIGIVKKNAILMIDVALAKQRDTAEPPQQAIYITIKMIYR